MKIAIITAMPEEFRVVSACLGALVMTRLGTLRAGACRAFGHEFLLVESGMGFDNAARAAEALIQAGHADLLISAGFCGGIEQELQVGDVVVAHRIVIAAESRLDDVPALLSPLGQSFVARQTGENFRLFAGTFVSSSTIVSKGGLKQMLSGEYPYPVVEMESGALAIITTENRIPLLALRAVSDAAAEELDFSLSEFCSADLRRILPHKVLLTILTKPRIIPQLFRLTRNSRRAAESLTAALSRLFTLLDGTTCR